MDYTYFIGHQITGMAKINICGQSDQRPHLFRFSVLPPVQCSHSNFIICSTDSISPSVLSHTLLNVMLCNWSVLVAKALLPHQMIAVSLDLGHIEIYIISALLCKQGGYEKDQSGQFSLSSFCNLKDHLTIIPVKHQHTLYTPRNHWLSLSFSCYCWTTHNQG